MDNKKTLKSFSLKVTDNRVAILDVFKKNKHFLNAYDIHAKLPRLDLVTIYRTLAQFLKVGLIRSINTNKESVLYELNQDHHHHIVCTNCDKVEEFTVKNDEEIIKNILKKTKNFTSISHHNFDLFGVCGSCKKS